MSYNNGVFSLFNQGVNITNLYADSQAPRFNPPNGVQDGSVFAKFVDGSLSTSAFGTISASSTISAGYGLRITGPLVTAGAVSNAFGSVQVMFNGLTPTRYEIF